MEIRELKGYIVLTDQKPEARAAARQAALAAGKQKKAAAQEAKKSSKVR